MAERASFILRTNTVVICAAFADNHTRLGQIWVMSGVAESTRERTWQYRRE